jgi:hypothetical protein
MMFTLQLVGSVQSSGPAPGRLRTGTISYIRGAHGGAQGGWRTIPYLAVNEKRPIFQGLLRAGNRIRTGDVQLGKLDAHGPRWASLAHRAIFLIPTTPIWPNQTQTIPR